MRKCYVLLHWICDSLIANHSHADIQYNIMTSSGLLLLYSSSVNNSCIVYSDWFVHKGVSDETAFFFYIIVIKWSFLKTADGLISTTIVTFLN